MKRNIYISFLSFVIILSLFQQMHAVEHTFINATEFQVNMEGNYWSCDKVKINNLEAGDRRKFWKGLCTIDKVSADVTFRYRIINGKEVPVRPTDQGQDINTKIIKAEPYSAPAGWAAVNGDTTWILSGPIKVKNGNNNRFFITRYKK